MEKASPNVYLLTLLARLTWLASVAAKGQGNIRCESLENILGSNREPDLSELTLIFRSPELTETYKLSEAAERIPKHPQYNPNQKLIIFVHDINDDPSGPNFNDIYSALNSIGESNILALDSSFIISRGINCVRSAAKFAPDIGNALGKVLAALKQRVSVYCIGDGLGGDICGNAGKTYQTITGSQIDRITALDPAGAKFLNDPPNERLSRSDAIYVDIIHTNAGQDSDLNGLNGGVSVYCIGDGLGGDICGNAGSTYQKITGSQIDRITALDSAGVNFLDGESREKLDPSDAMHVDAIITAGNDVGSFRKVGDADFYPNGGRRQPGCLTQACNHQRALDYFVESIYGPRAFLAVPCTNYRDFREGKCSGDVKVMGYNSRNTSRGSYFLQTAASAPFGLGEDGTRYVNKGLGGIFDVYVDV